MVAADPKPRAAGPLPALPRGRACCKGIRQEGCLRIDKTGSSSIPKRERLALCSCKLAHCAESAAMAGADAVFQ